MTPHAKKEALNLLADASKAKELALQNVNANLLGSNIMTPFGESVLWGVVASGKEVVLKTHGNLHCFAAEDIEFLED